MLDAVLVVVVTVARCTVSRRADAAEVAADAAELRRMNPDFVAEVVAVEATKTAEDRDTPRDRAAVADDTAPAREVRETSLWPCVTACVVAIVAAARRRATLRVDDADDVVEAKELRVIVEPAVGVATRRMTIPEPPRPGGALLAPPPHRRRRACRAIRRSLLQQHMDNQHHPVR